MPAEPAPFDAATFKAMATGEPYPVKAFFALANNTLMSFANTRRVYDAHPSPRVKETG